MERGVLIYLVYSFVTFALAWIIGHSKITLDFRTWLARSRFLIDLIECVGCLGFWCGLGAYWLLGMRIWPSTGYHLADMAVAALYTCASNLIIGRFVGIVE
jgi:hypothetical protein